MRVCRECLRTSESGHWREALLNPYAALRNNGT
jgi:hypothetical protein